MSADYDPLARANAQIRKLHAYVPGQQPTSTDWVKLNTNENPFPPSPAVLEAIQVELAGQGRSLCLYPNPTSAPLREAVARHHGLDPSQVLIGNGADDVLNLLVRVFAGPDRAVGMMVPSYSLYPVLTGIQGAELREVPFDRSMSLNPEDIAASGTNLFFLTSPNAPTGVGFSRQAIEAVVSQFDGIFAIDETYAPFADEDAVPLLRAYPQVVIVRSFSKAYSLAGLRVGYALASPEIIDLLDRVRDSYNLDRLAQAGALAALQDTAYFASCQRSIFAQRTEMEYWYKELGWFCYPSQANFHFVEPRNQAGQTGPPVSESLYNHLTSERVLVRHFPKHPLTQGFLRISLGTESNMQRTRDAITSWLKQ